MYLTIGIQATFSPSDAREKKILTSVFFDFLLPPWQRFIQISLDFDDDEDAAEEEQVRRHWKRNLGA